MVNTLLKIKRTESFREQNVSQKSVTFSETLGVVYSIPLPFDSSSV